MGKDREKARLIFVEISCWFGDFSLKSSGFNGNASRQPHINPSSSLLSFNKAPGLVSNLGAQ